MKGKEKATKTNKTTSAKRERSRENSISEENVKSKTKATKGKTKGKGTENESEIPKIAETVSNVKTIVILKSNLVTVLKNFYEKEMKPLYLDPETSEIKEGKRKVFSYSFKVDSAGMLQEIKDKLNNEPNFKDKNFTAFFDGEEYLYQSSNNLVPIVEEIEVEQPTKAPPQIVDQSELKTTKKSGKMVITAENVEVEKNVAQATTQASEKSNKANKNKATSNKNPSSFTYEILITSSTKKTLLNIFNLYLNNMTSCHTDFIGADKNHKGVTWTIRTNSLEDVKKVYQIISDSNSKSDNTIYFSSNVPLEELETHITQISSNKEQKPKNEEADFKPVELVLKNQKSSDLNLKEKEEQTNNKESETRIREIVIDIDKQKINIDQAKDRINKRFFIFGDIMRTEFDKKSNRAYLLYKYASSAKLAVNKMKKEKYNPESQLLVNLSNPLYRENIYEEDRSNEPKRGKTVFISFESNIRDNEVEEIEKAFKTFGLISNFYRAKKSRTVYCEYMEQDSADSLLVSFIRNKLYVKCENQVKNANYAFYKGDKTKQLKLRADGDEDNNVVRNEVEMIGAELGGVANDNVDISKSWLKYFDSTYNRYYFFNPFLNESVWDLPEGAELNPFQDIEVTNFATSSSNYNLKGEEINKNSQVLSLGRVNQDPESDYDDEAWEENDLIEKMAWDRMKESQVKEWMKRPARQQVTDTRRDTAYIEGNYDYNIWFDKYLTDRKEEKEKIPAMYRCNPILDTGYTKADMHEKEGGAFFCLYFAKGCCSEGINCKYYHRVPTPADCEKIENLRDVFGRSRFATHRNDMGGVGTFTKECRTLYVSDIKMIDCANPVKEMVRIIYENFSPWGEIEDVNYIPTKGLCFIRYSHRCLAEFAKEAMMDQSLVGEEILVVKWAYDDPNTMSKKRIDKEHENKFLCRHKERNENLKVMQKNNNGKPLPNTNYNDFYNNHNNPYASGYGVDEQTQKHYLDYTNQENEITNNCVKLSETLKMIEERNYDVNI